MTSTNPDSPWPVPHEKSRVLFEKAKGLLPGGVVGQSRLDLPHPLFMARAEGAYVEDIDGNRFVDFHCGFGSVLLGHNDPRLRETIFRTLSDFGVNFSTAHPLEVEFAERITRVLPSAERVVYGCIGSEITYHAIRLARVHTGRRLVVKFEGNYHGWHDYVFWSVRFNAKDAGPADDPLPVPQSEGMDTQAGSELIMCGYNDVAHLHEIFARYQFDIAAVIVEPIFHNAGVVMPKPGFLESCRDLCTRYGSVLIFDEVITGFRQGLGGAQELFGVTPDLTTLGKAIANGLPVSVLAGRREVMESLSPLGGAYFSGTFNGHLLSLAVADRCCQILESEPPYERLSSLGRTMRQGIEDAIDATGVRARIAQYGSVWSLHFSEGEMRNFRDIADMTNVRAQTEYRRFMASRGFYIHPHNVIRGYITAAHTHEQIAAAVTATRDFFKAHAALLE